MTVRHQYLPYCLQRLGDGRYIVLNRYYKPLGNPREDWVVYESHPTAQRLKGVTAAKAKAMSARDSDSVDVIYLYNDGCIPTESPANWEAYSKRLKVLAKLEVMDDD
ncbi:MULTISPECIES: hypothetical protein [unclassified Massilia]|uniref:hypothetical protein n=1 Tax=unclassified Massilia TaxID=2609279 RepID=UPI00177BEE3B|nr:MULTISPECIES: hypothetical protein [unclassified Massilia]MBD8531466.1 hypothetical protein [Massilia sp. CFBP 13647]MBD8673738.1 hypothetical protein [Massilia sp. CFBP 13721]